MNNIFNQMIKAVSFLLIFNNSFLNSNSAFAEEHVSLFAEVDASDGLVFDQNNNLYAASYLFGEVYRISPEQQITTLIDTDTAGPAGMIFDEQQNMYIVLYNANAIYRIDSSGNSYNWITGLKGPIGLDFDSAGNLYVANYDGNPTISKITPSGEVSAFVQIDNVQRASSVAIDDQDNVYLVNYLDSQIYKITPEGDYSLMSDEGGVGYGFIIYNNQEFFLTRNQPHQIEKMDLQGNLEVWAGTGISGRQNGPAEFAEFHRPNGLAVSHDGLTIMAAEGEVSRIRRIDVIQPGDQVPPYFVGEIDDSVIQGQEYNHTIEVNDSNGDVLSIEVSELPSWLTFDGVDTLSGTPSFNDSPGNYQITLTVSDGMFLTPVTRKSTVTLISGAQTEQDDSSSSGGGGGSLNLILLLTCSLLTLSLRVFSSTLQGGNYFRKG